MGVVKEHYLNNNPSDAYDDAPSTMWTDEEVQEMAEAYETEEQRKNLTKVISVL